MIEIKIKVNNGIFEKIESVTDLRVLSAILELTDSRYVFINNEYNRSCISNVCKLADVTIRKSISRLAEGEILIKDKSKGTYFINRNLITFLR